MVLVDTSVWLRFLSGREPFSTGLDRLLARDEVVQDCGLFGRGVGWIDAHLLASARVEGLQLWSADSRLDALAADLGVAYRGA
jgi:predicted nucleic acid-binding protein